MRHLFLLWLIFNTKNCQSQKKKKYRNCAISSLQDKHCVSLFLSDLPFRKVDLPLKDFAECMRNTWIVCLFSTSHPNKYREPKTRILLGFQSFWWPFWINKAPFCTYLSCMQFSELCTLKIFSQMFLLSLYLSIHPFPHSSASLIGSFNAVARWCPSDPFLNLQPGLSPWWAQEDCEGHPLLLALRTLRWLSIPGRHLHV